jgi:fatty-acyl-CoA synthase
MSDWDPGSTAASSSVLGDFCAAARSKSQVIFIEDAGIRRTNWAECVTDAERFALGLRRLGCRPGTQIGYVLTNSQAAATALMGAWLAGVTVLSLPLPTRAFTGDAYARYLTKIVASTDAEMLFCDQNIHSALENAGFVSLPVWDFADIRSGGVFEPSPAGIDDVCFIQFTSGSTATPRGCTLTMRAIGAQLERLAQRIEMDQRESAVAWLPLSHDAGVFGALLIPWLVGAPLLMGTPQRFLVSPRTWLADCASFRARMTAVPPSAIDLALRRGLPTNGESLNLRSCILVGERAPWASLLAADSALANSGLSLRNFVTTYGLAEATLAATTSKPGSRPTSLAVDAAALARGEVRLAGREDLNSTRLASAGTPLPDVSVRIDGGNKFGEIVVASPSLAQGYLNADSSRFRDGEIYTGDLGFMENGELYFAGRKDDIITVAGLNMLAGEVEETLSRITGVRPGSCVLVEVHKRSKAQIIALAEPSRDVTDLEDLEGLAHQVLAQAAAHGMPAKECLILQRGALPRTPSGKVQRHRCREIAISNMELVQARVAT